VLADQEGSASEGRRGESFLAERETVDGERVGKPAAPYVARGIGHEFR